MALTLLTILLRTGGTVLLLATAAIFLPPGTMAAINDRLGLAPLPDVPLTYYLARSGSAHYALRGILFWLASMDLVRYRTLIVMLAASNVVFGALMLGIDLTSGMPGWWTAVEGPFIVFVGLALLALASRIPK